VAEWDYDMVLKTESGDVLERRRFLKNEQDRTVFDLQYEFPDETLTSRAR